jgi:hypothetical protein
MFVRIHVHVAQQTILLYTNMGHAGENTGLYRKVTSSKEIS